MQKPTPTTSSQAINTMRWMTNLPERLTKIPINKLAIPGSHNSGAYELDPTTPISPGRYCSVMLII